MFRQAFERGRSNAAYPTLESLDSIFCDCLERVEACYRTLDKAIKVCVQNTFTKSIIRSLVLSFFANCIFLDGLFKVSYTRRGTPDPG